MLEQPLDSSEDEMFEEEEEEMHIEQKEIAEEIKKDCEYPLEQNGFNLITALNNLKQRKSLRTIKTINHKSDMEQIEKEPKLTDDNDLQIRTEKNKIQKKSTFIYKSDFLTTDFTLFKK